MKNKTLKKGQKVVYAGEEYQFVEYDPSSPTGEGRRAVLKREGIEPVTVVSLKELRAEFTCRCPQGKKGKRGTKGVK